MRRATVVCGVGVSLMLGSSCSEAGPITNSGVGSAGASVWPPLSEEVPDSVTQEPNPWLDGWGGAVDTPSWDDSLPMGEGGSLPSANGNGGDHDSSAPSEVFPPAAVDEDNEAGNDEDDGAPQIHAGTPPRLLLRGYREGLGNDKLLIVEYLTPVDDPSCVLEVYSNGNTTPWRTIPLPVPVEGQGASIVTLCTKDADAWPCDASFSSSPYNGNDALVVRCAGAIIDSFGRVGEDPGEAWRSATDPLLTTHDADLVRCGELADVDPSDAFVLDGSWASTSSALADPCSPDNSFGGGGSGPSDEGGLTRADW